MKSIPSGVDTRGAISARDLLCALAAGTVALALYVATLQPDLGGPEDTPKFQFLGHVLGTAHPPGYPLYVLLSYVFVKLPIGTIAYRADLFSAVMAALACGMAYLIGRQIGAARWFAFCAALGLATGASFWGNAVFAEVYSLAAVMAALGTNLLLGWGARGGAGLLLGAVAALSLGAGNHLTIVGLVPPFVLYVLLRNRRALTARVIGAAAVLILLGISQYGFIVLRTLQGAPYLESRASSLPELVSVVTAERYAGERFAFGPSALLTVQIPTVASAIGHELGTAGLLALCAGLIAAVFKRSAGAALLVGAACGMLAMVVNLSGDVKGFITPVMVLLWPLAGLGFDAIWRWLESPRMLRPNLGILAVIAAAATPFANFVGNYKDADHSGDTANARLLRGVYRQLPDRAAVVAENYWYDMGLHYLMLTGEGGPDKGIVRTGFSARAVRDAARDGRRVFAFAGAATFLGAEGLRFERAALVGPSLDEWLRALPRGTVIVGASAYAPVPFELSGTGARGRGRARAFSAFARIVGHSGAAWSADDAAISLDVQPGVLKSALPVFPGAVRASVDERGARIEIAGRTVAQAATGLAIGVFTPDGALSQVFDFPPGQPLRVPFEGSLYELRGESPCVEITTDAWSDVTHVLSTGSWVATLPAVGSVVIESVLSEPRGVRARSTELLGGGAARTVGPTLNADGSEVLVTELTRTGEGRPVFRLALDHPPVQARARVRPGGARSSVTVCGHAMLPLFPDGGTHAVLRPDFESEAYFGAGWGDVERTPTGRVRRGQDRATLLLPLQLGYDYRLSLDLAGAAGTRIDIVFDEAAVGACELRSGVTCEVALPRVLREGINTLTLSAQRSPATTPQGVVLTLQGARILRHAI